MSHADYLKGLIYEDFLNSIASVRAGTPPGTAFRDHEARVALLRIQAEAAEMGSIRHRAQISLVA